MFKTFRAPSIRGTSKVPLRNYTQQPATAVKSIFPIGKTLHENLNTQPRNRDIVINHTTVTAASPPGKVTIICKGRKLTKEKRGKAINRINKDPEGKRRKRREWENQKQLNKTMQSSRNTPNENYLPQTKQQRWALHLSEERYELSKYFGGIRRDENTLQKK